jgi:ABC-type glycerol-3-phosphate transport system permease component
VSRRRRNLALVAALGKQVVFVFLSLTILFPFYYLIVNSLKSRVEYATDRTGVPEHPTLLNFTALLEDGSILTWYVNSVVLTGVSVVVGMAAAVLAAYAFSRFEFKGGTLMYRLMISLIVIPPIVLILPLFVFAVRIGVVNTHAAAIAVYVGLSLPFSIFLLTSFFRTIPGELIDSARIDGASTLGTLWRIVVPLSKPALVTLALVNALFVWNDLLVALVLLQDESLRTLQVGVAQFRSRFDVNIPAMMAGLVLASWPAVVAYVLGQRYFVRGLLAGGLRG